MIGKVLNNTRKGDIPYYCCPAKWRSIPLILVSTFITLPFKVSAMEASLGKGFSLILNN
ncbi:MAG TPA: hypothetical protein PLM81_12620 [Ginsengibacter sp.]|nr:hypothetical protein [Ginsengibacter sp.]HRP17537.1 hypothetical protein [Ginsengibacter sp.]HRP45731.1 hypothetical protein [Ginsengibacter sp.]